MPGPRRSGHSHGHPIPRNCEQHRGREGFTRAANYLGACALTLPAGFSADRLPIGMQLIGAPFAEATVLHAAYAYEQAGGMPNKTPELT